MRFTRKLQLLGVLKPRKSSSIYKRETKKKSKVFNPKLLKPSSFTLIQTKSLKDTLTRSSVHRNQSLYNRSHRIYIYIYSILLVVKEFKKEEKNLKIVVKKSISNLPSYLSVIVSNPHKYKQKTNTLFKLIKICCFITF